MPRSKSRPSRLAIPLAVIGAARPATDLPGPIAIEELARITGVTVRNLREMHARAILQPPELVGRKGFYAERHVARVLLVRKLQSRSFSLAAIAAMLQSWQEGGGLMDVMGLEDALLTPGAGGSVEEVDVADAFPELLEDVSALATALKQELVVARQGRYFAPNAELLSIVKQQYTAGFPLRAMLADGDALLDDVKRIATRFRNAFFVHIVNPQLAAGATTALPEIASKVEGLRPLAVRLVTILLAQEIARGGGPAPAPTAEQRPAKQKQSRVRNEVPPRKASHRSKR